eukprot:4280806-Pleurochrysis_carterae.AAC.1
MRHSACKFTFADGQSNAEHVLFWTTRTCRMFERKGHEMDAVGLLTWTTRTCRRWKGRKASYK